MKKQLSLFEDHRLDLEGAIELSLASLREYGKRYRHWAVAYSGGKDSTATVQFVAWCIKTGLVDAPESIYVLYVDTRMELVALQEGAISLLNCLEREGINVQVVMPELDSRYFVYMLGRGVSPPSNRFRWCTPKLKIEPMELALKGLRAEKEEKLLMLTGVRLGESAVRDRRIAVSCAKDSGECGQGWFQVATDESIADTLAPLLHWRLCHVYDWIYFETDRHGYDATSIALIYGDDEVRTGCVGCPLASRDTALERLLRQDGWDHLSPLLQLKPLYREMKKPQYRLRKGVPEKVKSGGYAKNGQRMAPLKLEARRFFLEELLRIQDEANVDLINPEEESRIIELIDANTWPNGWDGDEIGAEQSIDMITPIGDELAVQELLVP